MRANLLMNCLWYSDFTPEELASALAITPEVLFQKIFGEDEFSPDEIRQIQGILALNDEETQAIFYR